MPFNLSHFDRKVLVNPRATVKATLTGVISWKIAQIIIINQIHSSLIYRFFDFAFLNKVSRVLEHIF